MIWSLHVGSIPIDPLQIALLQLFSDVNFGAAVDSAGDGHCPGIAVEAVEIPP